MKICSHRLYNTIKIFALDDIIFDVIGCLEYDPSQPIRKFHRHHLKNVSK